MNEVKIREVKYGGFPINQELAGVVPMALPNEQEALTADINANGQRDPIILWRGQVVDGRCRQHAILTLGNRDIKYRELDSDLTEDEVRVFVKSVNTRRNLTMTQKAMVAAKDYLKGNGKNRNKTAEAWGISTTVLDNAIKIATDYPQFIEPLFNGLSVEIEDKNGHTIQSNKITAIYAYVLRVSEKLKAQTADSDDHAWSANSYITTQAGKEWFYEFIKLHNIKNVDVMKEIARSANSQFKEDK